MIIEITSSCFNVFGKEIPYYGILFVLGFVFGAITALPRTKKYGIKKSEIAYSGIFAGVGGLLGAKLLSILTSIDYIVKNNLTVLDVVQNGFVFYGGLIGGFLGLLIYAKAYKVSLFEYCDIFAPSVALGHAIGRIGCLISGCCFGEASNSFIRVCYHSSVNPNTPLNTPLLAIPLIESVCLITIFFVCEILFYKTKTNGIVAGVYSFSYATIRFILECFRADKERGVFFGVSTSQYISLAIVIAVFIVACVSIFKSIKKLL